MSDSKQRKQHLEKLLVLIEECSTMSDSNFDKLHSLLQNECIVEEGRLNNPKKNPYLHNLRTTVEKQASDYKEAELNIKHIEYFRFLKSFKEDVEDELTRINKYA